MVFFGLMFFYSVVWCNIGSYLDTWYNWGGPAKVELVSLSLFTESTLVHKIKNAWLILLSHFILHHFASMLYAVSQSNFVEKSGYQKGGMQNWYLKPSHHIIVISAPILNVSLLCVKTGCRFGSPISL